MRPAQAARRFLPPVVSVAILATLFARMDIGAVSGAVRLDAGLFIAAALLVYVLFTLGLEAVSLVRLLPEQADPLSHGTAARIKAASYLFGILNYALGAGGLALLLSRRAGMSLASAAGVVLLISALDLGILLGLCGVGIATFGVELTTVRTSVILVAAVLLLMGFLLLRSPTRVGLLERLRSLALFQAVATSPARRLAEVTGLRVLFVGSFVSLVGLSLRAFDLVVPPGELVIGVTAITLVAALPIAAAGIGTSQAAFVYVFREHGDPETLLACSLVLSAGLILFRGGMGTLFAREYAREASQATRTKAP